MLSVQQGLGPQFDVAAFQNLVAIVEKAGIPLNLDVGSDVKRQALAFVISANSAKNGLNSIEKLICEIGKLTQQKGKRAACEVAWRLDQEIQKLMSDRVKKLGVDAQNRPVVEAIYQLYVSCKSGNQKKYENGDVVDFAGVPKGFIPLAALEQI